MSKDREIVVTCPNDCKFIEYAEGQYFCGVEDKMCPEGDVNTSEQWGVVPEWCPLLKGPIIVRLTEEKAG